MENIVGTKRSLFTIVLWLTLALSSIVVIEPAPYDLLILALFVMGVILRRLKFNLNITIGMIFLFLFIFSNFLSMFEMHDTGRGIMYFAITLYLIISWFFYIGTISFYGEGIYRIIFSGYTFAAIFSALLGMAAFFHVIPYADRFLIFGRASGLFKDPNVFGPFLVPISIYAIFMINNTKKFLKIIWVLTFIITTSGVMLSFSRASWANYTIALLTYLFLWGIRVSNKNIVFKLRQDNIIGI